MSFWRKIPHPTYGNYGGAKARCNSAQKRVCPMPVDEMDACFQAHDEDLRKARQDLNEYMVERKEEAADKRLARGLREDLRPYFYPVWGPIYRRLAMCIFRP